MDKADLIREITTRMMGGNIDSFRLKHEKQQWYQCFIRVSKMVTHIENMSNEGLLKFEINEK